MDGNPGSSTLVIRVPDSTRLALSARSEYAVFRASSSSIAGPGRILHQLYSDSGRYIEAKANRAAHNFGLGPDAVTYRIQDVFGSRDERESKLDELYGGRICNLRSLEKDCLKLMKHALPSESPSAQLQAFKGIVMLTTRYPGLRHLFLRCEHVQQAGNSHDTISALWMRVGDPCDREWLFFLHFTASCVSDQEVAPIVEKPPPHELGFVYSEKRCVIDKLLTVLNCHGVFEFLTGIAIRYLGGILELSTFWVEKNYQHHRSVAKGLFKRTGDILKDIGVDSSTEVNESMAEVFSDTEGIDILADAILAGVQIWRRQMLTSDLVSECWFDGFVKLIELLQMPRAEALVPKSWCRASHEDLRRLVPNAYKYELTDSVIYVYGLSSTNRKGPASGEFRVENDRLASHLVDAEDIPAQPPNIESVRGLLYKLETRLQGVSKKTEDVSNQDIILLVVGPAGAGKSTFINTATKGSEAPVGNGLAPCTQKVQGIRCIYPGDKRGRNVVFLDTPAFDDDMEKQAEMGKSINKWLSRTYTKKMSVTGILYMHRILDARMIERPLAHLTTFEKLCGGINFPQRTLLVTTMWQSVDEERGSRREEEIQRKYWSSMMDLGSRMVRFDDQGDAVCAWRAVDVLLEMENNAQYLGT